MKTKFFIGTSGFSYEHWIGKFYPPQLDRKEWLNYYCKYFNTTEVNMTFYRFPFPNVLKGWYNKTPKEFTFTFKANRLITHIKKFRNVNQLVKRFYSLLGLTKEKLGCVLWQLPPSMHFSDSNLALLDKFLSKLKGKNVIEFRHKSWWRKETYKLLRKHKAIFCIVSCPRLPDDFIITSDIVYVRFHGATDWYRHNYSKAELTQWMKQIKQAKAKEVYCYFNNDYQAYAPKNAMQLKEMLKKK